MLIEGKYAKKIDVEWPEDQTFISKRSNGDLHGLFCQFDVDINSQGKDAFTGRLAGHKSNIRATGTPSLKLVLFEKLHLKMTKYPPQSSVNQAPPVLQAFRHLGNCLEAHNVKEKLQVSTSGTCLLAQACTRSSLEMNTLLDSARRALAFHLSGKYAPLQLCIHLSSYIPDIY